MPTPKTKLSAKVSPATLLANDRIVMLRSAADEPDAAKRAFPAPVDLVRSLLSQAPNLRRGGPFVVTAANTSTPGYGPGSSTLADLPDGLGGVLALGNQAIVIFSADGLYRTYIVLDDAQGPLQVYRDNRFTGTLLAARWALVSSPETTAADYTSFAAGYVFTAGQLVRAYVPGTAAQQFATRRTAGAAPAPTAALLPTTGNPTGTDANWAFTGRGDVPSPNIASFKTLTGRLLDNADAAATLLDYAKTRDLAGLSDALQAAISNEATARANADTTLQASITTNGTAISAQATRLDTLVTGAPAALDTLAEIAAQLASDESGVAAILATQQQHTQQIAAFPTTTTGLAEGTNLYFTAARVLGTALASYSKAAASRAISAMDSVFVAIGILEKKADDNTAAATANTNNIGPITSLQTVDKSNLVASVNEVNANNFFTSGTNGGILVLKGQGNLATNYKSSVVAGESCTASGGYTVVLGGYQNIAQANDSVIIGGRYNQTFLSAPSTYGTIIGGRNNTVRANFCTITNSTSCSIAAGCDYTTLIGCLDLNITAGSNQTYINNVLLGTLTPPTALTPTTGTVTLDFAANPRRTLAAVGNVSFVTSNRSTAGAEKMVYVTNTTGSEITLTYEAWVVMMNGAPLPVKLAAGKQLILTLTCLGTSVSDVKAAAVISN